jgi:hypothetical protein
MTSASAPLDSSRSRIEFDDAALLGPQHAVQPARSWSQA